MDATTLFSALSLSLAGFLILCLVAVGLAAMRREYGDAAGDIGVLAVFVIGLCTFIMLMSGVVKARKLVEPIAYRTLSATFEGVRRRQRPAKPPSKRVLKKVQIKMLGYPQPHPARAFR